MKDVVEMHFERKREKDAEVKKSAASKSNGCTATAAPQSKMPPHMTSRIPSVQPC